MRHRAQRPSVRLITALPARRGVVAGTVVLLGASTGVGLVVTGADQATDRPTAGEQVAEVGGTTYPGAAARDAIDADRSSYPSRGQARTSPSAAVSAAPEREATQPSADGPADGPAVGSAAGAPQSGTSTPTPSRPAAGDEPTGQPSPSTTPAPSSPSRAAPTEPAPTETAEPAPAPAGPDTSAVTQLSVGGTWTVALSSDTPTVSFECSLDGGAYAPCSPVVSFLQLSNGRHTLSARAVDQAGNVDPSPVVISTTVTDSVL